MLRVTLQREQRRDVARSVQTGRLERAEEEVGGSEGKWESTGSVTTCFQSDNHFPE